MSYRRAWLLVDEINHIFREPLVEKQMGDPGGGGARLTKLGRDIDGRYRAIEGAAVDSSVMSPGPSADAVSVSAGSD